VGGAGVTLAPPTQPIRTGQVGLCGDEILKTVTLIAITEKDIGLRCGKNHR